MEKLSNYINGQLKPTAEYLDNIEPATGKVYSLIPKSGKNEVTEAYEAARNAFPAWRDLSTKERSNYILKISALIDANLEELASAESRDNGKPLKLARSVDIPRARDNFSFYATAILHQEGQFHDMGTKGFNYTLRRPLGVVGCISPWNLPLYLFSWKIAPALASGNCVVAKPSEVTPFTAYLLSKICIEAGLPAGVLNIVHGLGGEAGQAIVEHPGISAISFTGGTKTGEHIAREAAPKFKKLSLELGGKNPNVIFADCDFDAAVSTAARASFTNQGQICLCGSRIMVEESIYEKFKNAFVEKVKKLKVGHPNNADSNLGALVSEDHMNKVLSYVELAKTEGGTVLCGGKRKILEGDSAGGYYLEPTVIEGLTQSCRTNQEEIFGPVVTIGSFKNEAEAIEMANSTKYGLASMVWTENLKKAHRVAEQIDAGIVWVNCWLVRDLRTPFGGVKESGVGREGGFEALDFFTEPKNVCMTF